MDPVALAHEMISLLRSVRTPGGAVSAWPRQIDSARWVGVRFVASSQRRFPVLA